MFSQLRPERKVMLYLWVCLIVPANENKISGKIVKEQERLIPACRWLPKADLCYYIYMLISHGSSRQLKRCTTSAWIRMWLIKLVLYEWWKTVVTGRKPCHKKWRKVIREKGGVLI